MCDRALGRRRQRVCEILTVGTERHRSPVRLARKHRPSWPDDRDHLREHPPGLGDVLKRPLDPARVEARRLKRL
jgi:hypothetical protein